MALTTTAAPLPVGSGTIALAGIIPNAIHDSAVTQVGQLDPTTVLTINMILPLRNMAALQALVSSVGNGGIYLTQQQFDDQFGVPVPRVAAVQRWGSANGLQTTFTAGDGSIVSLQGSSAAVAAALHVSINTYRGADGVVFFANSTAPQLPATLGVLSVDGLNNLPRFRSLTQATSQALARAAQNTVRDTASGLWPVDFRRAYDVGHGYDGTGQVIGFTGWGAPVPNSDFQNFANATGEPRIVGGTPQNGGTATSTTPDQIDWIYSNGVDTTTDAQAETAMDTEYAHGVAPHAHLRYWLSDQIGTCPNCSGDGIGLENAISMAANDPQVHVVSNSWGRGEASSPTDPFYLAVDQELMHAVAVGTTFYFAAGDAGTDSGGTGLPSYPADDANVVTVGGTTLSRNADGSYTSEQVWANPSQSAGGGAGCSSVIPAPAFQNSAAVNTVATCALANNVRGRAEPDVAADADPNTGADVYYQGSDQELGGASLAVSLWAGMAAVANQYAAVHGLPPLGWAAPNIYTLAGSSRYNTDFHDVTAGSTVGSSTYKAGIGWDQASGWGSIDWYYWVRDILGSGTAMSTPAGTVGDRPLPRSHQPMAVHPLPDPGNT
jgi:subtilase family serine protease